MAEAAVEEGRDKKRISLNGRVIERIIESKEKREQYLRETRELNKKKDAKLSAQEEARIKAKTNRAAILAQHSKMYAHRKYEQKVEQQKKLEEQGAFSRMCKCGTRNFFPNVKLVQCYKPGCRTTLKHNGEKNEQATSAEALKSRKAEKAKSACDPNYLPESIPKRNMSAYFHFANAMRPKLMADDPTLTNFSVVPKVSALWRDADATTKAEYEDKARLDKERYLKEKEK